MEAEEQMEDLYKVLGLPGGGQECVGDTYFYQIHRAFKPLFYEALNDGCNPVARFRSSKLLWVYSLFENPESWLKYDTHLSRTIDIRRAMAKDKLAEAERRVALKKKERGVADDACGSTDNRQLSIEDLERRVTELRIEEKSLKNGPSRWRRRPRPGVISSAGNASQLGDDLK